MFVVAFCLCTRDWEIYEVQNYGTDVRAGSRKSAQDDKWSFCLTAGTLVPANQERP